MKVGQREHILTMQVSRDHLTFSLSCVALLPNRRRMVDFFVTDSLFTQACICLAPQAYILNHQSVASTQLDKEKYSEGNIGLKHISSAMATHFESAPVQDDRSCRLGLLHLPIVLGLCCVHCYFLFMQHFLDECHTKVAASCDGISWIAQYMVRKI